MEEYLIDDTEQRAGQNNQIPQYTPEYFMQLDPDMDYETAESMARRWNRTEPQTLEEVRSGRLWEEKQRMLSAQTRWAKDLNDN